MTEAKFVKEKYGATVATILETDDSIVEVQERNDGVYGLIVHHRRLDSDRWDDLTAYLKPEHFELLGSIARRMRGDVAPVQPTPTASEARSEFDLKRCPWCGGPADIEEIGGKDGASASFSVGCHDGDGESVCFGYQSLTSFARKSEAVRAWNTRASDNLHQEMKEALEEIATMTDFGTYRPEMVMRLKARAILAKLQGA